MHVWQNILPPKQNPHIPHLSLIHLHDKFYALPHRPEALTRLNKLLARGPHTYIYNHPNPARGRELNLGARKVMASKIGE